MPEHATDVVRSHRQWLNAAGVPFSGIAMRLV